MDQRRDGGEQLELPFHASERAGWQRVRDGARRAAGALGTGARWVMRWVLRLVLPLLGAAAALQAFPYHATVQGVPFEVRGTLLHRTTLSADTTLGSWEFPDFVGLPVGVHISPEDVDVLELTRAANGDMNGFVERLQADVAEQVPRIATWLVIEFLLGIVVGLAAAAAVNMSLRYLRGQPRRPAELRHRTRQFAAAALVTLAVTGYGVATYNPDWVRESRLTGTLAAAQLFPDQLSAYYSQQSKAFDVLGSVVGLQAALQAQIEEDQTPATALRLMFISDMHLAATYNLVAQYATSYDVDLIINTGDESAFGTLFELTPSYLDAIRAVTATTPMLWLAGNHDSPATEATMRSIPGVTVLGSKTTTDEGYAVAAGIVEAYGLTIAGMPDPRVYGGPGAYGADDRAITDELARQAVNDAVGTGQDPTGATPTGAGPDDGGTTENGTTGTGTTDTGDARPDDATPTTPTEQPDPADGGPIDIFATHDPVAAAELREVLPERIRQINSGHRHAQNDTADIQDGNAIDLVEGTTGGGGLDNIVRGAERPPIEFSIESVGADCQFTRVIRFQIRSASAAGTTVAGSATAQAYGDDVIAQTVYFRPQEVDEDRTCGTELGIGPERPW